MTPDEAIANLPATLEYTGEFGAELVCFIPFVHWLHVNGHLAHRRVITYAGMRPFYYFMDGANYAEKAQARRYVPRDRRPTYLPNRGDLMARKSRFEIFPDYRSAFGGRFGHDFKKPLLVIHNKHCYEWKLGPVNFIALDTLQRLFESFKDKFQIIYFREGFGSIDIAPLGFSADRNYPMAFDDEALLQRYPEVISFERLASARPGRHRYNELKLMIFADCHRFIASQGGSNFLTSIFGDATLVILHREGYELRGTYVGGVFQYAAAVPPRLLIARSSAELEDAVNILRYDIGLNDNGTVDSEVARLLEKYSPERSFDLNYRVSMPTVW